MPSTRNADGLFIAGGSDSDDSLRAEDDQDFEETLRNRSKSKGKGSKKNKDKGKGKAKEQSYAWEAAYQRSWDEVQEDDTGQLLGSVADLLTRGRRRRLLAASGAIRRSIIRHLVLAIDLSASMLDRDMRPSRFHLTLEYAREFISEWFDQNPLGQMGIVGMRSGLGERISPLSGNPVDLLNGISDRRRLEPDGAASLQNVIDMARSSMSHLPGHSSREILVIFGSLSTIDPGNIQDTLDSCVEEKVTVSIVALAAEMKICRSFCMSTGGKFGVALNEGHFKDLLFESIPPPAQKAVATNKPGAQGNPPADLMMMGFPARLPDPSPPSLCVCHSKLTSGGYLCPRCLAKLCDVPTDCDICGLMLVSSPHLARSYHHLFPVKPYTAVVNRGEIITQSNELCSGCANGFKPIQGKGSSGVAEGVSPLGRYRCPTCRKDFCVDCDVFVHEVIHVCPTCQDGSTKK